MKKALMVFVIVNLAIANCRTLSPITETDVAVKMVLNRHMIRKQAQYDLSAFSGGGWGNVDGEAGIILLGIVAVVFVGEVAVNILQGCDVYVYPEGYRKHYKQQVYWGENRVFLPKEFADSGGFICFEVRGSYSGAFKQKFKSPNAIMVIGDPALQDKLNKQLQEELNVRKE